MTDVASLLALPFEPMASLACGYLGYRIAFVGHDGPHSTVDVVFISLVFAAIAKAVMLVHGDPAIPASIPAFGAVFIAAVGWRLWLSPWLQRRFRSHGVNDHDRGRTAWESMLMRVGLKMPVQLIVVLKNGTELMCADAVEFLDAPLGPCLLGPDGSVGMYVTDLAEKGQDEWTEVDAAADGSGLAMTFVAASEIERVKIKWLN